MGIGLHPCQNGPMPSASLVLDAGCGTCKPPSTNNLYTLSAMYVSLIRPMEPLCWFGKPKSLGHCGVYTCNALCNAQRSAPAPPHPSSCPSSRYPLPKLPQVLAQILNHPPVPATSRGACIAFPGLHLSTLAPKVGKQVRHAIPVTAGDALCNSGRPLSPSGCSAVRIPTRDDSRQRVAFGSHHVPSSLRPLRE